MTLRRALVGVLASLWLLSALPAAAQDARTDAAKKEGKVVWYTSLALPTAETKVMSVVIFDLKEEGQFGAIAVLGLVMLVMTFATVALVQRVLGRVSWGRGND